MSERMHALVFPFPGYGHFNPLLLFSSHLALRGCDVTFLNPLSSSSSPSIVHDSRIRFVTVPSGLPPGVEFGSPDGFRHLVSLMDGVQEQREAVENIIQESLLTPSPITCIISDSFLPWTLDVAKKFSISRAFFWTGTATTFYLNLLVATGIRTLEGPWEDIPAFPLPPGVLSLHKDVIDSFCLDNSPTRQLFIQKRFQNFQDNASTLINTFHHLEGSVLDSIPCKVPIRCIGPLLPPSNHDYLTDKAFSEEAVKCLQWLDKQGTASVLYISFGTLFSLSKDQIVELAMGIEASMQSFLWVIQSKKHSKEEVLPQGFLHRVGDRGMVISWAPQLQVLSHPAVGGFLTHCGWNSILESIVGGIPMLCLPIMADQSLNSKFIVKQWKLGLQFEEQEQVDGPISANIGWKEVERKVRELMVGKEGEGVRHHVQELSKAAQDAISLESGSSVHDIDAFIKDMA